MIRRTDGNDWLLIAQADHAHLAAEIAQVWGNADVPSLPLPDLLLPAIRDHDDGWRAWEQSPEVDPDTGLPRDFTEMPMQTATRIWTDSIAAAARAPCSHAAALAKYRDALAASGKTLDGERAAALETLLTFRATFRREEAAPLAAAAHVPPELFDTAFDELLDAGILARPGRDVTGEYFALQLPAVGASPLGGLWVSRHFCYLGEKARENRDENETAVIDEFISEQHAMQQQWTGDSLRQFAGDELPRVIETGYRYVQFFDRLSLWLCKAAAASSRREETESSHSTSENSEPAEMKLPGGQTFQFAPESANRIRITPFPLHASSLELKVASRRIPAKHYNNEQLHQAIKDGETNQLTWTLSR